ncbi:MAG: hypothetical protein IIA88_11795, partial [Bacteroidetes bacterium]|nr:hypothetical protein [Bacteroidota bacterium]
MKTLKSQIHKKGIHADPEQYSNKEIIIVNSLLIAAAILFMAMLFIAFST